VNVIHLDREVDDAEVVALRLAKAVDDPVAGLRRAELPRSGARFNVTKRGLLLPVRERST
jgi:hypothetical protein